MHHSITRLQMPTLCSDDKSASTSPLADAIILSVFLLITLPLQDDTEALLLIYNIITTTDSASNKKKQTIN